MCQYSVGAPVKTKNKNKNKCAEECQRPKQQKLPDLEVIWEGGGGDREDIGGLRCGMGAQVLLNLNHREMATASRRDCMVELYVQKEDT